MAETLFIAVLMRAGFVVFFVVDAHGKARAFESGEIDHRPPPEVAAHVELPAPHFNQRDQRRRESQ